MLATGDESNSGESDGHSLLSTLILLLIGFFIVNFFVQIYRKPTELLRWSRLSRSKTPEQTWRQYGDDFRRNGRGVITADFLAALSQLESSGNPLASPGWTFHWSMNPWRIYAPASSAVGLLQMTNGNYGAARAMAGGGLYSRLVGSDSIEMTAAFLHSHVRRIISGLRYPVALRDQQRLAAVMHLCGPGMGPPFVRSHFNAEAMASCGGQPVGAYVRVVMRYRSQFARIAEAEDARSQGWMARFGAARPAWAGAVSRL